MDTNRLKRFATEARNILMQGVVHRLTALGFLPDGSVTLKPLERALIKTGLFIELPEGYEAQMRPRSGLALKKGITLLNTPGTIDADYRGEIGIILVNLSNQDFVVEDGERIAQMVIARHEKAEWEQVEILSETERGEGGFGHTGRK